MTTEVRRNEKSSAYELSLDGTVVGRAFFTVHPDHLTFTHTEVDDAVSGQHLGSTLAREALDDVRSRGELVVPSCPFIADWIGKHPGYADLVHAAG